MSRRIFDRLVADGRQRIQATAEDRPMLQGIHARVWAQHRAAFSGAPLGRRLVLRQTWAELAPPHDLYLHR